MALLPPPSKETKIFQATGFQESQTFFMNKLTEIKTEGKSLVLGITQRGCGLILICNEELTERLHQSQRMS